MKKEIYTKLLIIIGIGFILSGCGHIRVDEGISAQELWDLSKDTFEREKYLDAIELLTTFTLNHSGSTLIDSAQFLLAECHFILKEYIIAEAEYGRLVRNFPESPLVDDAWLKIILSFFYLSPGYNLDQKNTERTIAAINDFLDEFPETDLEVRLAVKPTAWQTVRQIFTLGIWKPPRVQVDDVSLYRTKVVYPHRGINFGQWLLRVSTFGIYQPHNIQVKIPYSSVVEGDWLVLEALSKTRSRLAKKTCKSGELYYRMKKYPSAVIYFDTVIEQFADTPWAPSAHKLKGDSYFEMRKYLQAADAYQRYLDEFNPDDRSKIEARIDDCHTLSLKADRSVPEIDAQSTP